MGGMDVAAIRDALKRAKQGNFMGVLPATPGLSPGPYSEPCSLAKSQSGDNGDELCQLAETLLSDPQAVRQLGDRIYELMERDIQYQRENFGKFRG